MNRSSTFLIAAITFLAAAGGIVYWQLNHTNQEKSVLLPVGQTVSPRKSTAASVYQKLTDPSLRWEVRVDMLRRMNAETLTPSDIETLFSLLRYQPDPGQQENWWVVANEIMEQMRLQAITPESYAKEMLALMRDPAAPEVMRDYAVQHLGQWVSPRGAALGQPSETNQAIVRETAETFAKLITDPANSHSTIPGTTLMLLIDMRGGGVPEEIINPVIDSINPWFTATLADTNQTSKITRISAINAIGMLQLKTFRPEIRSLATSETADPSLRLNSIAALGQIGDADDIPTLETIAKTDPRLQHAALAALDKLKTQIPN
jgi:hypothetical protein